jgi:hypothetical protein
MSWRICARHWSRLSSPLPFFLFILASPRLGVIAFQIRRPAYRKPSCRNHSAHDFVHWPHGLSLGRTPKSWAARV